MGGASGKGLGLLREDLSGFFLPSLPTGSWDHPGDGSSSDLLLGSCQFGGSLVGLYETGPISVAGCLASCLRSRTCHLWLQDIAVASGL